VAAEEHRQVSRLKVAEPFFGTERNAEIVIETSVGKQQL
jgi:hypothetical protein